ncbi:ABC transporter permease, partial [Clostridium saudiense]|nr:ABC transporter permease [Clostridium saudiense]
RFKYIGLTFFRMVSLLIAVSIIAFILVISSPIDPLTSYVGSESTLSQEAKDEIAEHWGLNDPPVERFIRWGKNVLRGDLGTSITFKQPVSTVILERFKYSIVLMVIAWLFSGILGFITGILAGAYKDRIFDRIVKVFCLALQSAPTFWIGLLVLSLFAVKLGWFPIGLAAPIGKLASDITIGDRIYHLILPAFTLSVLN